MSLIKQSEAENNLSPQICSKIHLCAPVSQPDATGYSVPEMEAGKADLPNFVQDFVAEHSSSDAAAKPGDPVPGSFRPEAPKVSKSAQA
jgi:hypothetical protein